MWSINKQGWENIYYLWTRTIYISFTGSITCSPSFWSIWHLHHSHSFLNFLDIVIFHKVCLTSLFVSESSSLSCGLWHLHPFHDLFDIFTLPVVSWIALYLWLLGHIDPVCDQTSQLQPYHFYCTNPQLLLDTIGHYPPLGHVHSSQDYFVSFTE